MYGTELQRKDFSFPLFEYVRIQWLILNENDNGLKNGFITYF